MLLEVDEEKPETDNYMKETHGVGGGVEAEVGKKGNYSDSDSGSHLNTIKEIFFTFYIHR